MNKKVFRKKLLSLLMIISIVATDFWVLGANLITYSSDISSETNNPNVEFLAYFKNDANERIDSIEKSIKDDNLKLYAEVAVKNEGYLNEGALIEIEDSNFKLKNNVLSPYIKEINGNKIILKQITAGEKIEVELEIEPIISETLVADMLSKISIVKLNGLYTGSTDGGVQCGKQVCLNFKPDESANAELETDIITNAILPVGTTNKRVVQLLIKSRLTENQYPVKQTKLNVTIPELGTEVPEVSILSIGGLSVDNWTTENATVEFTIKNDPNSKNEINWSKNVYDEIIVTYIYPDNVDASKIEIATNSEIKLYNSENTYTAQYTKGIENKELNNVVIGKTEITTQEMYKGKIYANIETPYSTKTTIVATKTGIVDSIVLNEGPDVLKTETSELEINTKYITTEINLNKMLEILGQEGNLQIKNGETITTINKDSVVNENGNVVINHENSTSELVITASEPQKEGILEITHTKAITENTHTRAQLQTVKTLNTKNTVSAFLAGTEITLTNSTEQGVRELKETTSKAELTILSTGSLTTTEQNELKFGITLITENDKYDLYSNPEIAIQLPEVVESVQFKEQPKLMNDSNNEFVISSEIKDKIIKIKLTGNQNNYPESDVTQLYIPVELNVTLSKLATTQTGQIKMLYKNDNATQYYGNTTSGAGIVEKTIEIEAKPELLKIFNLIGNENTSLTETIKQQITKADSGKTLGFETMLINNTEEDMKNVRILGKLPIIKDDFEAVLKNISASNATIYYTEDINADINNAEAWTETYTNNAKAYLINIGTLSSGSNYSATINLQLPNTIKQGLISYAQYKVIYDTETKTNVEEESRKIGLATGDLEINLTAQVGQDLLSNLDSLKEGEVIKYTATVTNNIDQVIENIELKAGVPEGTTVVEKIENNEYTTNSYYEEKTDLKEMSVTIPTLQKGETYTLQYEVRINSNITTGTEISNQLKATYNDKTVESEAITNKLEEANVRVTIKKANDKSIKLTAGSEVKYDVIIENLSNETISGLGMQIISDDFTLEQQETLGEIPANGKVSLKIKGKINNDAEKMQISANITDSNNTYRSNMIIEEILDANATISLTTPQNNASLKEGDTVEYNIVVKNTGSIAEYFKVYYSIFEELSVQTVKIGGKTISQATEGTEISNLIYEGISLNVGETKTINIIAKVKKVETNKVITNSAKVEVLNVYKDISEEIKHTLLAGEVTQPETPTDPEDPNNPNQPDNPTNPENPNNPNQPGGSGDGTETVDKKSISGIAWLDVNRNGEKDIADKPLEGIKVKIYNTSTNNYLADKNGNIVEAITDTNGKYTFENIDKGLYILIFEYNAEEYEPTIYCAEGVNEAVNSNVVLKKININGQEITATVTDTIDLQENVSNINIGLKEKLIFDLELNKYISRIVVQTTKGTKAYDYENDTFEKVEIHRKQMQGALVVLEYTIKVKNNGEIAGYAKNIIDYIPEGLVFASELNKDWYFSGDYLYTKALENEEIKPGEEKEIKLILTKTMTADNIGLINNRAEIFKDYNQYGESDIDSTPNNQIQGEDDYGTADVSIQVATGGRTTVYMMLVIVNLVLIGIAINLMIKNNVIKISTKKGRR